MSGSSGSALSKSGSFGVLARGSMSVGGPGNIRVCPMTRPTVAPSRARASSAAVVRRIGASSLAALEHGAGSGTGADRAHAVDRAPVRDRHLDRRRGRGCKLDTAEPDGEPPGRADRAELRLRVAVGVPAGDT